jgi:hypothetical protein
MITVVTEGPFHERLLTLLLADVAGRCSVQVIAGGNRDAARPLARQESLQTRQPVAFVIDADTEDAGRVTQQQRDLDYYFAWGGNGQAILVVQFVPSIEIIFFERPRVLERLIGRRLDPAVMVAGEIAPRAVLDRAMPELGERKLADRLHELTPDDLRELRTHPAVASIRHFVEAHAEPAPLRRSA